jgi:transcriptional regulator with XRE-family HTH domain
MAAEGLRQQDLGTRTGVHPTQFQKIRDGVTRKVDPETLRKISAGTGIPLLDLIVASGMFTAAELGARVVHRDPQSLTNEELLALVSERMRTEPAAQQPAGVNGETADDDMSAFEPDQSRQVQEEATGRQRPRLVRNGADEGAARS